MSAPGNGSVCGVVVTFNRKQLLRDGLKALRRQTRPLDQIVVVNNHSSDGTDQLLAEEFAGLPRIDLQENCGGAGGFHEGMKWAYGQGYEWMWVMDDDIEPLPSALETMLRFQDVSRFIHARREAPEGMVSLEALWDLSSCWPMQIGTDPTFEQSDRPWISIRFGNFEGALIHRSVVDKAGLPDSRFFITGDDTMYGFLASFHTNVIYIRDICFRRMLRAPAKRSRLSFYLHMRNRFLVREHLRACGVPVDNRSFWFRLLLLAGSALKEAARGFENGWRTNARAVIAGLYDGARGRYGRPPWIPK